MNDDLIFDNQVDGPSVNLTYSKLIHLWRTEVHAPDILPYQQEVVEELKLILIQQQEQINVMMDHAAAIGSSDEKFTAIIYQMDIERVRYSLTRYLRIRILKIEQYIDYILSDDSIVDRLSTYEKVYITNLYTTLTQHMEDSLLSRFDENIRKIIENNDEQIKHCTPNQQRYVFAISMEDIYDFCVDIDEYTTWIKNDIKIVEYQAVRDLIYTDKVNLL